jgi:putative heme-binding domain-containing protein
VRFVPISRLSFLLALALPAVAAERVPWTSSQLHGSPEPPSPYVLERAFPKITFHEPLDAAMIPGTNRFVVAGLHGDIVSVPYDDAADHTDVFADMTQWNSEVKECYSIAFHPRFAENRLAFVWVNLDLKGKPNRENGTKIVKFQVTTEDPPRLDLASGVEIFSCTAGGHNGGNLRFGADGMLYFGLGDTEVPDPPDTKVTGQDISDVHAGILRIDVDHEESGRHYAIPKDNPFITTPNARGEVWAYGLRNPWRLTFSPEGELWVGDVGWELWESIIHVQRGGNYGWSITEASRQDVRPDRLRGPTPILPPTYAHSHEEADSITCGVFYTGKKLPELRGSLIYGDWQVGTFWSLTPQPDGGAKVREMCKSPLLPVGFGLGGDGEAIACDQFGGGLWRFARNPDAGQPSKFPRLLSETGLFSDVAKQTPAPGVYPYETKATRWADGATSRRWIALPERTSITPATKELGVLGKGRWVYPQDSAFALTYARPIKSGDSRNIETQVLHFDGIQWGAYSYRWNAAGTDAELVGTKGEEANIEGLRGPQPWRYFSRSECLRCHNMWTNYAPGFSPAALDQHDQLAQFAALGIIPETKSKPVEYGNFAAAGDAGKTAIPDDLNARAREYLNVNCGTCHRFGGGGSVRILLDSGTKLADMRLLNEPPLQGSLGLPEARIVAPGDPGRSVLLQRMATGGRGHMPYLGARSVDDAGLALINDWIAGMPADADATSRLARDREALQELRKAGQLARIPPQEKWSPKIEALLGTGTGALELAVEIAAGHIIRPISDVAIAKGAALSDPLRRDLFEHRLPPEQRRKTLGTTFDRDALLARKGDATRGRAQFVAVCAACHRHGADGRDFGPDLTKIGAKYPRPALLEQIVEPAKIIEPAWQLAVMETNDGKVQSGFVSERAQDILTVRLADGTAAKIPAAEIKKITMQKVSVMPEGLLASFTAQEAADLLEFLARP